MPVPFSGCFSSARAIPSSSPSKWVGLVLRYSLPDFPCPLAGVFGSATLACSAEEMMVSNGYLEANK